VRQGMAELKKKTIYLKKYIINIDAHFDFDLKIKINEGESNFDINNMDTTF
jgi:hypothetical protein